MGYTWGGLRLPQLTLGSGAGIDANTNLFANKAITTGSSVLVDIVLDTTAPSVSDSGAGRFTARQLAAGNSAIRALECQTLRSTGASQNSTWGLEVGVHSQVAGNGVTLNVGAYIASSHSGWLVSGVRNDTAVLITGEDGWTHGIRYYDTDGATVLFDVNQSGNVGLGTGTPTASNTSGRILEVATGGNTNAVLVLSAVPTSASGKGGILEARSTGAVTGDARLGQLDWQRSADVTSGKITSSFDLWVNNDGTLLQLLTGSKNGIVFTPATGSMVNIGAAASAPAAGSAAGCLVVQTSDNTLIYYSGGNRYKLTGVSF